MTNTTVSIFDTFVYQPTECQSKALMMIEEFLENPQLCQSFVLRGSAGTGKTSLMQTVVAYLKAIELNFVLLAPTGKATKILSDRTYEFANTIHSQIYKANELADGTVIFNFKINDCNSRMVFIVDEASMLASEREQKEDFITPNPILNDLIRHIFEGNKQNQVIFIGDTYQLPPVNEEDSAALSARMLNQKYGVSAQQTTLKQVMRQTNDSPVLKLANEIKTRKDEAKHLSRISLNRLPNEAVGIDYFLQDFDRKALQNIICIAQSNKRVQELNFKIRNRLGLGINTLSVGDVVMLNRNWVGKSETASKGDLGVVLGVNSNYEERAGLRFLDVKLDIEGKIIETKILANCLLSEKGEVNKEALKALKADRMAKNANFRLSEKASDDPYMSAMHLRYGYAITCHKAQGSEWKKVLIDPQYNYGNHRWLYTAVTRASEEVWSWFY